MANHRSANVIFVDTSAAFTIPATICSVKYIGNTSGTAAIRADASASGSILWEESGTANLFNEVEIRDNVGIYVEVSNGAKVYVYLEVG